MGGREGERETERKSQGTVGWMKRATRSETDGAPILRRLPLHQRRLSALQTQGQHSLKMCPHLLSEASSTVNHLLLWQLSARALSPLFNCQDTTSLKTNHL